MTCTVYGADEDPNVTAYNSIATTTILGYSGAVSKQFGILDPGHDYEFEGETVTSFGGTLTDYFDARKTFDIEAYGFTYEASDSDVGDYDDVMTVLRKRYKWIAISAGSRTYHTAGHAIPVSIPEKSMSVEKEIGERTLRLTCQKRFIES